MAQVTVKINGYAYNVGCEDGQERHLMDMAAEVESRIDSIKALGSQTGEARLLVLATLLMADELHDQRKTLQNLQAELARLPTAPRRLQTAWTSPRLVWRSCWVRQAIHPRGR